MWWRVVVAVALVAGGVRPALAAPLYGTADHGPQWALSALHHVPMATADTLQVLSHGIVRIQGAGGRPFVLKMHCRPSIPGHVWRGAPQAWAEVLTHHMASAVFPALQPLPWRGLAVGIPSEWTAVLPATCVYARATLPPGLASVLSADLPPHFLLGAAAPFTSLSSVAMPSPHNGVRALLTGGLASPQQLSWRQRALASAAAEHLANVLAADALFTNLDRGYMNSLDWYTVATEEHVGGRRVKAFVPADLGLAWYHAGMCTAASPVVAALLLRRPLLFDRVPWLGEELAQYQSTTGDRGDAAFTARAGGGLGQQWCGFSGAVLQQARAAVAHPSRTQSAAAEATGDLLLAAAFEDVPGGPAATACQAGALEGLNTVPGVVVDPVVNASVTRDMTACPPPAGSQSPRRHLVHAVTASVHAAAAQLLQHAHTCSGGGGGQLPPAPPSPSSPPAPPHPGFVAVLSTAPHVVVGAPSIVALRVCSADAPVGPQPPDCGGGLVAAGVTGYAVVNVTAGGFHASLHLQLYRGAGSVAVPPLPVSVCAAAAAAVIRAVVRVDTPAVALPPLRTSRPVAACEPGHHVVHWHGVQTPDDGAVVPAGTTHVAHQHAVGVVVLPGRTVVVNGTADRPVLFTASVASGWAGFVVQPGGTLVLRHAWVLAAGATAGDPARVFGHSASSAAVLAAPGARVVMTGGGIVDAAGKAFGAQGALLVASHVLVSRCDTGGEFKRSVALFAHVHFVALPDDDGWPADDDNDALYFEAPFTEGGPALAVATLPAAAREVLHELPSVCRRALDVGHSCLSTAVLMAGEDDGVDHAGANLVLDNVWIEDFAHEGVAASGRLWAGPGDLRPPGSLPDDHPPPELLLQHVVVAGCAAGVEAGYGTFRMQLTDVLLTANGHGFRYGDDYAHMPNHGTVVWGSGVRLERNRVTNLLLYDDGVASAVAANAWLRFPTAAGAVSTAAHVLDVPPSLPPAASRHLVMFDARESPVAMAPPHPRWLPTPQCARSDFTVGVGTTSAFLVPRKARWPLAVEALAAAGSVWPGLRVCRPAAAAGPAAPTPGYPPVQTPDTPTWSGRHAGPMRSVVLRRLAVMLHMRAVVGPPPTPDLDPTSWGAADFADGALATAHVMARLSHASITHVLDTVKPASVWAGAGCGMSWRVELGGVAGTAPLVRRAYAKAVRYATHPRHFDSESHLRAVLAHALDALMGSHATTPTVLRCLDLRPAALHPEWVLTLRRHGTCLLTGTNAAASVPCLPVAVAAAVESELVAVPLVDTVVPDDLVMYLNWATCMLATRGNDTARDPAATCWPAAVQTRLPNATLPYTVAAGAPAISRALHMVEAGLAQVFGLPVDGVSADTAPPPPCPVLAAAAQRLVRSPKAMPLHQALGLASLAAPLPACVGTAARVLRYANYPAYAVFNYVAGCLVSRHSHTAATPWATSPPQPGHPAAPPRLLAVDTDRCVMPPSAMEDAARSPHGHGRIAAFFGEEVLGSCVVVSALEPTVLQALASASFMQPGALWDKVLQWVAATSDARDVFERGEEAAELGLREGVQAGVHRRLARLVEHLKHCGAIKVG